MQSKIYLIDISWTTNWRTANAQCCGMHGPKHKCLNNRRSGGLNGNLLEKSPSSSLTSTLPQKVSSTLWTKAPTDGCNMRSRTDTAALCHITTAESQTEQALSLAVLNLLTFVVCFSLMIILDSSTTHIGIVALTVKDMTRNDVSFFFLEQTWTINSSK